MTIETVPWCAEQGSHMTDLEGLTLETLVEDDGLVLARSRAERILIMTWTPRSGGTAARLEHHYGLREDLDATWALRPVELRHWQGSTVLVAPDPGGQSLSTLVGSPLETTVFLRVALGITSALARLHARSIVHRDLKPASILVEPSAGTAWLGGLGRATHARRQRQAPEAPSVIAGTLAYMAPEQTGRMNRSVDSRSDLYSLGVLFYQLLVGELPFSASDPMELVHCHVARRPTPPAERSPGIPTILSAVVMKLLSKLAEDRYQTAAGVEADLQRCQREWLQHGQLTTFTLGDEDASEQLLVHEKLYGREAEIEQLLSAFHYVVESGRPTLVLVSGNSGVGKSSAVSELHRALLPTHGFFASGKFDQYQRDAPYAALAQVFQRLVSGVLVESEEELARYRDAIRAALHPYGKLVVNLVPELEQVIGKQPPIPDLGAQDAQRVFEQISSRFLGVFARPAHPLAIFLDDLQWVDTPMLDLLEHLLLAGEAGSLLLVGAYRSNEVGPPHSLSLRLKRLRQTDAPLVEIQLAPLTLEDVASLISDTLRAPRTFELAEIVHQKTLGNPFFVIQFLTALADDGLLCFERSRRRWVWDLPHIVARGFTDNVVALMLQKITRLPPRCREMLQVMACLGHTARLHIVASAAGVTADTAESTMGLAVRAGLLARQRDECSFLHDRVQEAAYASIFEADRAEVHLRIGRRLLAATAASEIDEGVFEIVGQLNRGLGLVTDIEELDCIAELNLRAARRAKAAAAHASALAFARVGTNLLGPRGWERRRELAFGLALEQGECEFLTGELDQADARLTALVDHAEGLIELAAIACLRILLYVTSAEPARSVDVCLEFLARQGIHLSPHPAPADVSRELDRMWTALGARTIEDLAQLPAATDAATLATLDVLCAVASPAWFVDQLLPALLGAVMANFSIERGNSPASSFGYAMLGTKLGPFAGDYRSGYRFGKLGLELAERSGNPRMLARVLFVYTMFVRPWAEDLEPCRALLERGFTLSERAGDLTYATYFLCVIDSLLLTAGAPLEETDAACRRALAYARQIGFQFAVAAVAGQLGLTRMLRGESTRFGSFDHAEFDEVAFERTYGHVPALALPLCWYWVRRQQASFLAGDASGSVAAADAAEPLLWVADVYVEFAEHHFYAALALAEYLDAAPDATRPSLRQRLEAHAGRLAAFGESSPVTFGSRAALVAAELARVDGRERSAMDLYERAIQAARSAGFVHLEALSLELAARFYAARGFASFATTYRREARGAYVRWGAHGKVQELERRFPELRERPSLATSINAPIEQLDLATVLKVSQTVAGEMVFPRLIDGLMRTALEQAGATRGLLVTPSQDGLRVEAEAQTVGEEVVVRLSGADGSLSHELPESLVRFVIRTRTSAISDDAANDEAFGADPYLVSRKTRAIACLPLVNQSRVTGALYLENGLAPQTFTSTRIAVLKLLASHAGVSIDNTRLYANLEEREAKIRRLVDANVIGIFIWNVDGTISDPNDAFLRMLYYEREDLHGHALTWSGFVAPAWRERAAAAADELEATGTVQPYELEYLRRDGSTVPVLVGAAAFARGSREGVAFVLDLSKQRWVEHELRRSEAYLAEAQRLTHTGSFSYDITREQLGHCSEELSRLFGFDPSAPTASLARFWQRVHEADRTRTARLMLRAIRLGIDFEVAFRLSVLGQVEPKYIHCLGHPVFDGSRKVVEFVGTVMDVTERRQADQERDRLRQAQADLAHVTRVTTLGELAASLAHEIKQPLAGALMNAATSVRKLMHDTPDLNAARRAAERVSRDVQRAADIVGRIGSLFKKHAILHEPVELSELVSETIGILRSEASRYSITLHCRFHPGLTEVMADRVQVQQVVLNLIVNAIEATRESPEPRAIVVSAQPLDEHALVSVSDTGVGLPGQETSQIFEAFFTTKREGTGMGLSISRSLVESHGGRLSARDNADRGATFQFTLPLASASKSSPEQRARERPARD